MYQSKAFEGHVIADAHLIAISFAFIKDRCIVDLQPHTGRGRFDG